MPRNGSGVYGPPPGTAAVPNTTVESADYNAVVADMAQALTDSINVDGTAPFQANQSMGNNKLTSMAAGTAAADSVNLGQVQSAVIAHAATVGGTADAITLTFSPVFAAYTAKMRFRFTASGANTITNPTVNIDGMGAKTVKKLNSVALEAGDIAGAGHVCDCVYDGTDVLLLNFAPMTVSEPNTFTAMQTFNKPTLHPFSLLADAATIAWDMAANSDNVKILLSASRNLGAPTNLVTGQRGLIIVQQDGTGNWALTPNAIFKQAGGQTIFDQDKAANSRTIYAYEVIENSAATKQVLIRRLWSEGGSPIGSYKDYDTGAPTAGTLKTQAHGLGRHPSLVMAFLENTSAELGWTAGMRVSIVSAGPLDSGGGSQAQGFSLGSDTTNVFGVIGSFGVAVYHKSTFVYSTIDSTKWKVILRVYE